MLSDQLAGYQQGGILAALKSQLKFNILDIFQTALILNMCLSKVNPKVVREPYERALHFLRGYLKREWQERDVRAGRGRE